MSDKIPFFIYDVEPEYDEEGSIVGIKKVIVDVIE